MGYDAWKADDGLYAPEEFGEREESARDAPPRYRLRTGYDPLLRWSFARLLVQHETGEGYRTLDEATAPGDDAPEAVRRMRQHRRLVRGVL